IIPRIFMNKCFVEIVPRDLNSRFDKEKRFDMRIRTFAIFVALLAVASAVSAQDLRPDNRYKGYPASLIQWPKGGPDLDACQAQEYYEPADVHLTKYVDRVKVDRYYTQETDY